MTMIPACPDAVPIEILNTAVLTASQKADWVEMIVGLLAASPAERLNKLGPEVRFVWFFYMLFVLFFRKTYPKFPVICRHACPNHV